MRWIVGLFALLATPAFAANPVCAVSSPTAMTTSSPKVEAAPSAPSEPLNSGAPSPLPAALAGLPFAKHVASKGVRIPTKPAIDSDRNQPPVPIEASQAFRRKPAGVAVWSEGSDIRLRSQPSRQVFRLSRRAVFAMIRL